MATELLERLHGFERRAVHSALCNIVEVYDNI